MTIITQEKISSVTRWLLVNSAWQKELIVKDPLIAEHHRREHEMFKLALDVILNLIHQKGE